VVRAVFSDRFNNYVTDNVAFHLLTLGVTTMNVSQQVTALCNDVQDIIETKDRLALTISKEVAKKKTPDAKCKWVLENVAKPISQAYHDKDDAFSVKPENTGKKNKGGRLLLPINKWESSGAESMFRNLVHKVAGGIFGKASGSKSTKSNKTEWDFDKALERFMNECAGHGIKKPRIVSKIEKEYV